MQHCYQKWSTAKQADSIICTKDEKKKKIKIKKLEVSYINVMYE